MNILQVMHSMVRLATPILLIAMGGLFSLKVNIFNLGLEAFALMGCFSAVAATYITKDLLVGCILGIVFTTIYALIYAFFVIELKVNPVICAIAFITLTSGLTRFLMKPIFGTSGKIILESRFSLRPISIGLLNKIPIIGPILNNQTLIVYIALISPIIIYFLLFKTKFGLFVRAVGQNEEAASAAGIKPRIWKYIGLALTGIFCGLAGAQLSMSMNLFNVEMTAGRGFTALAVLIMTKSNPIIALFASLLFGLADAISNVLSTEGFPPQFLGMLPYVLALIAVISPTMAKLISERRKRRLGLINLISDKEGMIKKQSTE